jgi:hypothetical protein
LIVQIRRYFYRATRAEAIRSEHKLDEDQNLETSNEVEVLAQVVVAEDADADECQGLRLEGFTVLRRNVHGAENGSAAVDK